MPFSYYKNLNTKEKSIYRQSDKIREIKLKNIMSLRESITNIKIFLEKEDKVKLEKKIKFFLDQITDSLEIQKINIKILSSRPSNNWGELHGLYEQAEGRKKAKITLWMKTAKRKQVIAFKTFIRTLVHEISHHLDYCFFDLPDSFHTEGFFYRESSIYKQLVKA
ncbi:MAG: hypothetical protein CBC38_01270 [Gammaproteobacteria bacterium TMED78]|nr:MAG: hypothetical protein CBC38_01270 [Gammaproteobacteria bacterium TMED78]